MIVSAALIDLHGPKILSLEAFTKKVPDSGLLDNVLNHYYELAVAVSKDEILTVDVAGRSWLIIRVNEATVIVAECQSIGSDKVDLMAVRALYKALLWKIGDGPIRPQKDIFPQLVQRHLMRTVKFAVITAKTVTPENHSGVAVLKLVDFPEDGAIEPLLVGPFKVFVTHCVYENFHWTDEIASSDGFALVVSPNVDEGFYHKIVQEIRSHASDVIMVVPSSDEELEFARKLEDDLEAQLCDSVSDDPVDLILAMLATAMLTDMHPELAQKTWKIRPKKVKAIPKENEGLGHQAFIVTEKTTGKLVYSYYYETKSKVLERAPNLIAAISMFRIDSTSAKTSVFKTGTLNFIMIEHGNLVFTLITGNRDDVDELREKFSFLPDLWADENPEDLNCATDDLYKSPPFTLKLLATLPPEYLLPRMVPFKVKEPNWNKFNSELVCDFLKAVWDSLDGHIDLQRLANGSGPQMTLGAIHLLRRLGAIDLKIVLRLNDRPELVRHPTIDERTLYSELGNLLKAVNGSRDITEISKQTGIDNNVLITVFTELYKRGIITIHE